MSRRGIGPIQANIGNSKTLDISSRAIHSSSKQDANEDVEYYDSLFEGEANDDVMMDTSNHDEVLVVDSSSEGEDDVVMETSNHDEVLVVDSSFEVEANEHIDVEEEQKTIKELAMEDLAELPPLLKRSGSKKVVRLFSNFQNLQSVKKPRCSYKVHRLDGSFFVLEERESTESNARQGNRLDIFSRASASSSSRNEIPSIIVPQSPELDITCAGQSSSSIKIPQTPESVTTNSVPSTSRQASEIRPNVGNSVQNEKPLGAGNSTTLDISSSAIPSTSNGSGQIRPNVGNVDQSGEQQEAINIQQNQNGIVTCPICESTMFAKYYPEHEISCEKSRKYFNDLIAKCGYCGKLFSEAELTDHIRYCPNKKS